jgi:hypothetical protein
MSIAGFNIAIPLYGTKLREYAEESNYLKNVSHASGQNHGNPIIETPEFSYDDLKIMVALANWVVNFSIKEKIVSLWRLTKRPWSYIKFFSSVLKKS